MNYTLERDQVARNLWAKKAMKFGNTQKAICLFEKNVSEGFDGSAPYYGLALIYKQQHLIEDEIRVLEQAVKVYESIDATSTYKLKDFKDMLTDAILRKIK